MVVCYRQICPARIVAVDYELVTASLIMGVATASADTQQILVAGVAGLVAGAMSMAAGECVSVSSKADTEQADLARERIELQTTPEAELEELTQLYVKRGLTHELAGQVAVQLTANDALDAHSRDELGIVEHMAARPIEAAVTSAATFAIGAAMPLLMVDLSPASMLIYAVSIASLLFLALLGAVGAKAGGAHVLKATARVTFWGAFAMALTAGIGALVGTAVLGSGLCPDLLARQGHHCYGKYGFCPLSNIRDDIFEHRPNLAGQTLQRVVIDCLHRCDWIDSAHHDASPIDGPHNHIARQHGPDSRFQLHRLVGHLRITGSKYEVVLDVGVELVLHRRLDIDFGQDPKTVLGKL